MFKLIRRPMKIGETRNFLTEHFLKVLKTKTLRKKDIVGFSDTFNLSTLCVKVSHIHFQLLWK